MGWGGETAAAGRRSERKRKKRQRARDREKRDIVREIVRETVRETVRELDSGARPDTGLEHPLGTRGNCSPTCVLCVWECV